MVLATLAVVGCGGDHSPASKGVHRGQNVDLVFDGKGTRAHQTKYVREASGAYVDPELPQNCFFLVGEAVRLDAPPWPELALALLAANFGVKR